MNEINLSDLIKYYTRNWIWIVIFTTVGALIGFVYNEYIQVPLYKSDVTLLVQNDKTVTADATLINNYMELIKTRRVIEPALTKQNINVSYDDMVASITATNTKGTQVIKVSASTKDPNISKSFLENLIDSLKEQVKQIYKVSNVQVVDTPNLNTNPYNLKSASMQTISTVAGFFLSIVVMFFVYDFKFNKKDKNSLLNRAEEIIKPIIADIERSEDDETVTLTPRRETQQRDLSRRPLLKR